MFKDMAGPELFRTSSELRQAAHYAHKAWMIAFPVNRELAEEIYGHITALTRFADMAHEEMGVRGYLDVPAAPVQP
jgi:hypothetical protein